VGESYVGGGGRGVGREGGMAGEGERAEWRVRKCQVGREGGARRCQIRTAVGPTTMEGPNHPMESSAYGDL
jgi:hypothetical protein